MKRHTLMAQRIIRFKLQPLFLCLAVMTTLVSVTLAQQPQEAEVLLNADIVTMSRSGLGPELIVLKIQTTQSNFNTSGDALAVLKAAGVSDEVIAAMLRSRERDVAELSSPQSGIKQFALFHYQNTGSMGTYHPGRLSVSAGRIVWDEEASLSEYTIKPKQGGMFSGSIAEGSAKDGFDIGCTELMAISKNAMMAPGYKVQTKARNYNFTGIRENKEGLATFDKEADLSELMKTLREACPKLR